MPLRLEIDDVRQCVSDTRPDGQLYEPELGQASNRLDYGMISRLPNPQPPHEGQERVVFLIEGTHTFGLAAASRMLTKGNPWAPDYYSELLVRVKGSSSPYWQALIKVEIGEEWRVYPEVVQFVELTQEQGYLDTTRS